MSCDAGSDAPAPHRIGRSAADWAAFAPEAIPSKGARLPPVFDAALSCLEHAAPSGLRIVELGCGCGELAAALQSRGHEVLGVDVNAGAVARAAQRCPAGRFVPADVGAPGLVARAAATLGAEARGCFDFAVLQLLLSVVGGPEERRAVLGNAAALLRAGGALYLSCSGASEGINAGYAALYERDAAATGEFRTYFSRDEATGEVLYVTHHFTAAELEELLRGCGFEEVRTEVVREASSRRPTEAAYFLYTVARKGACGA